MSNEEIIWDYFMGYTNNAYGTAALMGNLMAESSLSPVCATNLKKAGYDNVSTYTADSDSGKHDFAHDGVAFGLVQWCFWSRKQALLEYARNNGGSVSNLKIQLEYMCKEMSGYKDVWNAVLNAANIRDASDIVMLKYERPGNTGEVAKAKRAAYGQQFYDQFVKSTPPVQVPTGKKMVRARVNVNIRSGKSTSTTKVGELKKGQSLEWLATENGWHKVAVWVSGDFSEVIT